ncbi:site-specific integrase [uncultured Lamprocystis sp.]|uniref:tyrosine-type recombinase/integrase n=1 Tax=uncultured Lamprocystis sp. TaxID=543132 RepID=UPI0025E17855|nr:site-specific integrase [uncultured Lamprocystis sp.]
MRLTKRAIDAATYTGTNNARCVLWDDEVPGFGCRIFPSGRKGFVLSYRAAGRSRLLTIGTYGVLTLDQARTVARSQLAKVKTEGADPVATREQERQGETMRDLCLAYMDRHGNAKKSGSEDQRRIDTYVLPKWGSLEARTITRPDVETLHRTIGKRAPYEANRVLALLSKMFELARRWGFVPEGHGNPARDIDRFTEAKRDRWVSADELPRLAQAINEEPNASARAALWLYLLTGARKTELLTAQWSDVDWTRAELRLPDDTKAGRVHYIPLSPPAVALLRDLPQADGNPFILPGKLPGAHLVNISKPWGRVRTAAGVADVRLHDLRRTVGSWLAQSGNSLHLIGRVLNHSNQSTTAVYARFGEDSVRAALDQHGARIMGAAGLTPTAEVTALPTRKAAK